MRQSKKVYASLPGETARKIAEERKRFSQRVAAIKRQERQKKDQLDKTIRRFRPKKSDRGNVVFVGIDGKPASRGSDRKGYAIYTNKNGKKSAVRQLDRVSKRLEKFPVARKLKSIDIARVKSKRAKLNFWRAYTNEVVSGKLKNLDKQKKVPNHTRFSGQIKSDRIDQKSSAVKQLAKELAKASNLTPSKKDFLVTIGIHIRDKQGKSHFVTTQQRFSRQDRQKVSESECENYFGLVIYGFLAQELAMRDLVLAGSAKHVARLKENKGASRDEWTKNGFLWQGHDMQNVTIQDVEYRFDQLTLGK